MVVNRTAYSIMEGVNRWAKGDVSFPTLCGILGVHPEKFKTLLYEDGVINGKGEPDPVLSAADWNFYLLWRMVTALEKRLPPK